MIIESLGAGVQSSTVFMMSCFGELPKIDHAVFADAGWESQRVYEWLEFLKEQGVRYGIPIHTVSVGNIKNDALVSQVPGLAKDGKRWASIPYFTKEWIPGHYEDIEEIDDDQIEIFHDIPTRKSRVWVDAHWNLGMIKRQCTSEYKIRPLEKKFRELAGYKKYDRIPPGTIEVWKGISTDEESRANLSRVKWYYFHYPLLEYGMSRYDCRQWFSDKGFQQPPRSSCIGCVYHSNKEWLDMKLNRPDEWSEAVEFDRSIRKCGGMRGDIFLHAARVPLEDVNLSKDDGQQKLWREECQGICGI